MLATKYENLYYEQKNGTLHHYIRFMHNGQAIKRKVSAGLSHKDAYRLSLTIKDKALEENLVDKKWTIDMLVKKLIASKKSRMYTRYEKNTLSLYNTHFSQFFNRYIETISLQELQKHINSKLETFAHATAYQIKRLWIEIYKMEKINNIARQIEIPKFDNTVYFDIHIDDARRLYKAILDYPDLVYQSIFLFGIQGRRKGEIAYLKWSDVDFKNKCYFIRAENNKARKLTIYSLMEEQIDILMQLPRTSHYIHSNQKGKPLYFFQKRWKKLLIDNQLENMRFHDLRHMLGCLAINEGFSEEYIAKALGHTTTAMVKRYSRVKDAKATDVVNAVKRLLS